MSWPLLRGGFTETLALFYFVVSNFLVFNPQHEITEFRFVYDSETSWKFYKQEFKSQALD